jgi:hypothetical protein
VGQLCSDGTRRHVPRVGEVDDHPEALVRQDAVDDVPELDPSLTLFGDRTRVRSEPSGVQPPRLVRPLVAADELLRGCEPSLGSHLVHQGAVRARPEEAQDRAESGEVLEPLGPHRHPEPGERAVHPVVVLLLDSRAGRVPPHPADDEAAVLVDQGRPGRVVPFTHRSPDQLHCEASGAAPASAVPTRLLAACLDERVHPHPAEVGLGPGRPRCAGRDPALGADDRRARRRPEPDRRLDGFDVRWCFADCVHRVPPWLAAAADPCPARPPVAGPLCGRAEAPTTKSHAVEARKCRALSAGC